LLIEAGGLPRRSVRPPYFGLPPDYEKSPLSGERGTEDTPNTVGFSSDSRRE